MTLQHADFRVLYVKKWVN